VALLDALERIYPPDLIEEMARETTFIERARKLRPVPLFWALTLSIGVGMQRTIEGLRGEYNQGVAKDDALAKSSFAERFDDTLVKWMHALLVHGMRALADASNTLLKGPYSFFDDILVQDSSTVTLASTDALAKKWPSMQSKDGSRAALKVCVLLSLANGGPLRVELKEESTSEHRTLKLGPWVRNKLLLIDLGFFAYNTFDRIQQNGGYFVSRVRSDANPTFARLIRQVRGRSISLEGKKLKEVLPDLKREVLDADVEVTFHKRKYAGKARKKTGRFRMVGIRDDDGEYHLYLTNVPDGLLTAEQVSEAYRARWSIECAFNQLKECYSMDELGPTNPHAVEAMLWTALLTLIVSQTVKRAVLSRFPPEVSARMTNKRWAIEFRRMSGRLHKFMMDHLGYEASMGELIEITLELHGDPNVGRDRLLDPFLDGG